MRRPTTASIPALAALALVGCQATAGDQVAQIDPAVVGSTQTVQAQAAPATFSEFLADIRVEAAGMGVRSQTLDAALGPIRVNQDVLERDQNQAEFTRAVWQYLDSAVSDRRIADGVRHLETYGPEIGRAAATYGVEAEVMTAIWGLESGYGTFQGTYNVIESLATLAYSSRRAATFRTFLLDALLVADAGDRPPSQMLGSWAGAMGQPQFMPTAYLEYAVDGDGDGRRDIWGTEADVAASIGNYLNRFGWTTGMAWGAEVRLPPGFDYAQAELDFAATIDQWAAAGVTRVDGSALQGPRLPGTSDASVLLRAGYSGPAFLITDNFRTILRYNNSSSYALAVSLLSDRLAGRPGVQAPWPRDDRPLTREERIELQERLAVVGFDPGPADGLVGPNTRRAIRGYQASRGLPADGYANPALLERLRG